MQHLENLDKSLWHGRCVCAHILTWNLIKRIYENILYEMSQKDRKSTGRSQTKHPKSGFGKSFSFGDGHQSPQWLHRMLFQTGHFNWFLCWKCCFRSITATHKMSVVLGPQRTHWLEQTGLPRNSCTRDRTQSTPVQPALAMWHIRHIKSHMDESMRQFWGTIMCHVSPAVRQPSPVVSAIIPASYHGVLFVSACKNLGTRSQAYQATACRVENPRRPEFKKALFFCFTNSTSEVNGDVGGNRTLSAACLQWDRCAMIHPPKVLRAKQLGITDHMAL